MHLLQLKGFAPMPITPQDLVSTVATLLDMPVNTVKNYDRKLMEAGLRTKKGHGRGSAIMSPRDAAMLLVAIASNDEITRAAEGTSKTRELPLTARILEGGGVLIACAVADQAKAATISPWRSHARRRAGHG